jgi:crotonobetainyl-CoA:carnitine CoA-transferase CaiB-like acyl-CoA transferase
VRLLNRVRVLDLSRLLPGPLASMLLADMGADVIKVEEPTIGDYMRTGSGTGELAGMMRSFLCFNRNKRDIAVDFGVDEGRQIIYDLASSCDVFIESARPGALAKLGLGYDRISLVNPRIVYCSVTGFGQTGPFAQLATHGGAFDAVTGMAAPPSSEDDNAVQDRPSPSHPRGGIYGGWMAALGICAALVQARDAGEGAYLDISCADSTLTALGLEMLPVLNGADVASPTSKGGRSAKSGSYRTKDDRWILLQSIEQHFWEHFCEVVGRPDLATRGDWSTSRMELASADGELREELVKIFQTRTQAEWTEIFVSNNIAGAPYYARHEVENTELFKAREMIVEQRRPGSGQLKMVGTPIKVAGQPFATPSPAPEVGQHTAEVLAEIGYTEGQIRDLVDRGLVS